MLDLWTLNVGHGDSVVLRVETDDGFAYGVIDSNVTGDREPAALRRLHELGADRLSFVMLTHPHADHYRGMLRILKAYEGKVSTFYSFPIRTFLRGNRRQKLTQLIRKLVTESEGEFADSHLELAEILVHAHEQSATGGLEWAEPEGRWTGLFPEGGHSVKWEVLLPLPASKGPFYQLLDIPDARALTADAPNMLSIVLRATIGDSTLLLGADSTFRSWYQHRRQMGNYPERPSAVLLKVPHHGSRIDVDPKLFGYWFEEVTKDRQRYAIISADGRRHPTPEVLRGLSDIGVHPYCTNLARPCGAKKIDRLFTEPTLPHSVSQVINSGDIELESNQLQPCQGEIHVHVSREGAVTVTPQFPHPCGFRGDFARLVGAT